MKVLHHYNADHHSTRSADVLIPALFELIHPASVLDVGCGIGHWLQAFMHHGVKDVYGIDGPHVSIASLQIPSDRFLVYDLRQINDLNMGRKYDLVICLEVAEHLPSEKASELVAFLVKHGAHVMFSAAIPHQTGENHLNEQPFGYWQKLFADEGYAFVDLFRKRFWNDDRINWWYRQNLFLAVPVALTGQFGSSFDGNVYVHPELLQMYVNKTCSLQNQLCAANSGIRGLVGRARRRMSLWYLKAKHISTDNTN